MSKASTHKASGPAIDEDDSPDTGAAAKQRISIVSASEVAPVATTAARSVFDVAKPEPMPPKAPRVSFDLTSVVIRTDVPVPDIKPGVAAIYPQLWARIPSGGMVELPERQAHGLMAHVKKIGGKAAVRKLREGVKGVWRLA